MDAATLKLLLPEGVLAAGIVATIVADLLLRPAHKRLAGLVGACACLLAMTVAVPGGFGLAGGLQAVDLLTVLARPAILGAAALLLLAGGGVPGLGRGRSAGEWHMLVLALAFGALLTAGATSLLSLWLGLEIMSLAGYALAGWRDRDGRAAEAGMKYVLFGGVASGLSVFGISHLYGLTGTLSLAGVGDALALAPGPALLAALALAGAGLAYKLALVPMHFYAPDVYQGAPAASVAVLGSIPKMAALAVLIRILELLVPDGSPLVAGTGAVLAALAVATLAVSAFTALAQRDAKRILAFSAIGHAGAMALALAARPAPSALAAAIFYAAAYAAANIGAFLCLARLEADAGSADLSALAGLARRRPWISSALCLFIFSLVGIPPLAGFLAKWAVLMEAVRAGLAEPGRAHLAWAGVALVVAAAVAAFAYLKVVRALVLDKPAAEPAGPLEPCDETLAMSIGLCALLTVGLGLALPLLPALARLFTPAA